MKKRMYLAVLTALTLMLSSVSPVFAATETAAEEETDFSAGEHENNHYISELFNLQCEFDPAEWYMANEEEMVEISGLTADKLADDDMLTDMLKSGQVIMDMFAQNITTASTVNVQVETIDNVLGALSTKLMSDEMYLDTQYDLLLDQGADQMIFESLGVTDGIFEKGTVTFCDKEMPCIMISGDMAYGDQSIPIYECLVFVRSGNYVATITAASFAEDQTANVMALFSSLE